MVLIQDGKRFDEQKFTLEADFEAEILAAKEKIFGRDTIYIEAKKKIGTQALGSVHRTLTNHNHPSRGTGGSSTGSFAHQRRTEESFS